jgi:hypothetical protein
MKIFYSLLLLSLVSASSLLAQPNLGSWQWANKEGGVYNTTALDNEVVNDIATDKYGNVYITGIVNEYPHFGNVIYSPPFSSFGRDDAFVAKYDKCGNLKWARFGGGIASDGSVAIHVDDSLNVYIIGGLGSSNASFPDSNHTLTVSNGSIFWAKYDSLGNIKWVKTSNNTTQMPQAPARLIAKPDGNLSTVLLLNTGLFYSGFNFTSTYRGDAVFEFDLNGNPVSMLRIDSFYVNAPFTGNNVVDLAYDSKDNIILSYVTYDTVKIFDTVLKSPSGTERDFLVKANPQTHKITWIKEFLLGPFAQGGFGIVVIDDHDNIYPNGGGGRNSVFNGDTIRFNTTSSPAMGAFFKLDSNGNTLGFFVADQTNNGNVYGVFPGDMSFFGNQYIATPINIYGPTYWGGDTLNYIGNPFIMTYIDLATMKVVFADSIEGSSINDGIAALTSDEQGNVYAGGYFTPGLIAGNTITSTGGINDAFVLKWGLPCPDTDALIPPLAAIDLVASASGLHAIDVNWHDVAQYADRYRVYRSTTDSSTGYSLIDSVSNSTTLYTDVNVVAHQIYWYRVSAVNHAGETFSNSDSSIIIPNGIAEISDIRHIALYPNPANDYTKLSIWSDATSPFSATISFTDMEGRVSYSKQTQINQGKNDLIIDISEISAGMYIVNLRGNNETYSKRLVVVK